MLTDTLTLCAADRISSWKISLGTSQPNGPQEYEKPAMYKQMKMTTRTAYHISRCPGCPFTPNFNAIAIVITIYKRNQH